MKKLTFLLIILLSLYSCKKKKQEKIVEKVPCVKTSEVFTGNYHTYTTTKVDTVQITFVKTNCPTLNSNQYKITNLSIAFAHWGVNITNKDYYVNSEELNNHSYITDTLDILTTSIGIKISVKKNGIYTPYLEFSRHK